MNKRFFLVAALLSCNSSFTTDKTTRNMNFGSATELFGADGVSIADTAPKAVCGKTRVLVLPFDNRSGKKALQYLSLGLAADVAERLENDPCLTVSGGPLVLEAEQASADTSGNLSGNGDIARLAAAKGANLVLTGKYSGTQEKWTLTVDAYVVQDGQLHLAGSKTVNGNQLLNPDNPPGTKPKPPVKSRKVQALLAEATTVALTNAGIDLADKTVQNLYRPQTEDSYAFILNANALAKVFQEQAAKDAAKNPTADGKLPGKVDDSTALGAAEHAVRVDPKYEEARRLYAWLLADSGTPKSLEKARLHYEEALKVRPDDFRALMALGRLETQAKNFDEAKGLLVRAAEAKPAEADPHYWLGKTLLGLEDHNGARTQFETARNLSGTHLDARRELVSIYTAERRYAEAAKELEAVTTHAPKDLDAAFRLAACYRAANLLKEAAGAYAKAAERFPKEARFAKFLGDILMALDNPQAARKAYETAFTLAPRDPRINTILGIKAEAPPNAKTLPAATLPLGGLALVKEVVNGADALALTEGLRPQFQDAANNAVALAALGKDKCAEARASGKLARLILASYAADGQTLALSAAALKASLAAGEDAALTPDELSSATGTIVYSVTSLRDWREMLSLQVRSVRPALARLPCKDQKELPIPSIAAIRERNLNRIVELPDIKPPRWRPPASPDVPSDPVRIITFAVTNRASRPFSLTLDDDQSRPPVIRPGEHRTFTARIGFHRLCLVPIETVCDQTSIRNVALHEGWETIIQPGKP